MRRTIFTISTQPVVAVVLVLLGFRLATQSGLTGYAGSVQNDGYAASGCPLVLIGGIMLGNWLSKRNAKRDGKK